MASEVLSVEGSPGLNCSSIAETNRAPKFGATGGLLEDGNILVCGGSYGNFSAWWDLSPESRECHLYSKLDQPRKISMLHGRQHSASIVIGDKLFVTGGRFLSTNLDLNAYLL